MEEILLIAKIVALVGLASLCVALIVTLIDVRRSLREFSLTVLRVEHIARDVAERLLPILDHIEVTASRARAITQEVSDQIATIRSAIRMVNIAADSVSRFRDRVEDWLRKPFQNSAGLLAGVIKGAKTFASRMRSEEDEPGRR